MMPFTYPDAPHVRRHRPQGYADYASYRPWLRDEFSFRCVYCLLREQWGRIQATFHLDHFRATAQHPEAKLTYDNLLYCCAACNATKGNRIVPDPCNVLLNGEVVIGHDGNVMAETAEAQRLVRELRLDRPELREFRKMWINVIGLAKSHDPALYDRLMGLPEDLPNLARLRPPGGNSRPEGIAESWYERRRRGALPLIY